MSISQRRAFNSGSIVCARIRAIEALVAELQDFDRLAKRPALSASGIGSG
jgi:hypothetical protein